MGMLSFALAGNYKRYYNDLKEISKTNGKSPMLMFIDTAICAFTLKSGLQDYINYKFYEKTYKERKTYITIGNMEDAYKTLASIEYADFFSDKTNFHKNFAKYAKREYLPADCSYEEYESFLSRHPQFVIKPIRGLGGGDVRKSSIEEIEDKKELFNRLKNNKEFLEELIIQDDTWGALSPNSVNTVRVMTTQYAGQSKIIFAAARIGSGKSIVDNFHQGGMTALVDLVTGKIEGNALDQKLNEYEISPAGIKLDGFQIPYWEDIKQMVLEAALVNDKVNIIGWDVAISKNGPLIIESNRGPGFDIVQVLLNKGTKYMLDDLIAEVLNEKLKNEKKEKVENT